MRASVVVAPRERLTSLPGSLRSLFATLPSDLHVVVVEGGTPDETRAELRQLATDRPFDLVSLPYMVKSNEARNLGVTRTSSEFVIIADNDIEYEPGWFEALAEHALANRSDAASPLVCIGPPPATVIHQAGGRLEASRVDGEVHLGEVQRLMDVPLADVDQLPGVASDICEFHCILVRRSLLDEMGGLDERLVTREHIDFAMRALVLNAKMTFCERAVVTYMARDVFDTIDVRYHLFRWADRFVVESLDAFENTWGVSVDRDMFRYAWAAEHRARAAETTYPRLRRVLGKERFRRWVVARLERTVVDEQLRSRGTETPSIPRELPHTDVDRAIADLIEASANAVDAH
jgi:GT2 family glycosyltransferase